MPEHAGVDGRHRDRRGHVRLHADLERADRESGRRGESDERQEPDRDESERAPTTPQGHAGERGPGAPRAVGLEAGGDGGHESRRSRDSRPRGRARSGPRRADRRSSGAAHPSSVVSVVSIWLRSRSSARESRDLTVPGRIPSALGGLRLRELEQVPVGHDEPVAARGAAPARRAGPAAPPAPAPRPRGTGPRPPSRGRPRGAASAVPAGPPNVVGSSPRSKRSEGSTAGTPLLSGTGRARRTPSRTRPALRPPHPPSSG